MTHELQRISFVPAGDRPEGRWSVEGGPSLFLERQTVCYRATVDRVERFNLDCHPATSGKIRAGIVLRSRGREISIQGGRYFALSPARRQATITYNDVQWIAEPHATKGLLISRASELVGKIRRNRPFLSVTADDLDLLVVFVAGFVELGHALSLPWTQMYDVNLPMPYRRFPRC